MKSTGYNSEYFFAKALAASLMAAGLSACAPVPRNINTLYQPTTVYTTPAASSAAHNYKVSAIDAQGNPVPGVDIAIDLNAKGTEQKTLMCKTDDQGNCPDIVYTVNRDPALTYVESYSSTAKFSAEKEGYYKTSGSGYAMTGSSGSAIGNTSTKIRMIRPSDYLDESLADNKANQEVRAKVLKFLEVIKLQSLLVDSEVMIKGIGISEFKGKKYLRIKLNSTTTYNSLKLNKYDIGKTLFDDTIRKVLNPLNDHLSLSKNYFGYDLIINGSTKSFAEKYASATKVEYRFLLPGQVVRRYKEKEISGQALLDASVQLMDDERIELKLQ